MDDVPKEEGEFIKEYKNAIIESMNDCYDLELLDLILKLLQRH